MLLHITYLTLYEPRLAIKILVGIRVTELTVHPVLGFKTRPYRNLLYMPSIVYIVVSRHIYWQSAFFGNNLPKEEVK